MSGSLGGWKLPRVGFCVCWTHLARAGLAILRATFAASVSVWGEVVAVGGSPVRSAVEARMEVQCHERGRHPIDQIAEQVFSLAIHDDGQIELLGRQSEVAGEVGGQVGAGITAPGATSPI